MEVPTRDKICGVTEKATKTANHKKLAYEVADSTTEKAFRFIKKK
jgi:hypothetical protein